MKISSLVRKQETGAGGSKSNVEGLGWEAKQFTLYSFGERSY